LSTTSTSLVTMREFARLVGLTYGVIRLYRHQGKLPEADVLMEGKPLWLRTTVEEWKASRGAAKAEGD
jgi:predicted DNA-binding transcriptional regulator AlpA